MTAFDQLPPPILDKLRAMIRRVRRLLFLRGLFATLAVALVCLLAIMAIDASVTLFSTTSRWALSLVGLSATLAAAWWFLVRPLSRRYTLARMARILEIRHPELQERISTAVELLASDDPDSIRGSRELIEAVVESAVVDVDQVDPKTEFKPVRSKKFLVAASVAAGILIVLLAIWPRQSWTLLTRALAPFLDIGNAYADTLVVAPGDVRVAKGQGVTFAVSVKHKRLKRAELRRRLPDGGESVERMTLVREDPDGRKHFSLTFPAADADFEYRVAAGSALSEYFDVTVVEPPGIESLAWHYDFPDYTGLPDAEGSSDTGGIRAVAHTRVKLEATLKRPAAKARLILGESATELDGAIDGTRVRWEFELSPEIGGGGRFELTDAEGFTNPPATLSLEVLPDKAPSVRIIRPESSEIRLKPTESLPLDLALVEDFGFGDLVLLVTPDGALAPTEVAQAAPVAAGQTGHHEARALLDLPALKLSPGQHRLTVQARARDNRPADYDGPGVGLSDPLVVILDQNAKSLADQAIEAQRAEVELQIREARKELERARDDLHRGEQQLIKEKEVNSSARKNLDEFTRHNDTARDKLEEVAATLDSPLFREQSGQAARLAREPLAEAQEKVDMIPMTDARHERVAEAKAARSKVEEAIAGLDQLSQSMRDAKSDYEAIAKLNQLANRQQELAARAGEWSRRSREEEAAAQRAAQAAADENARRQAEAKFAEVQRRESEAFRKEQNQVEQQLGEMLKKNAAALAEVLEHQRAESERLAAEAAALAERQESMRETSESATEAENGAEKALREALIGELARRQSQLAAEAREASREAGTAAEATPKGAAATPTATAAAESLARASTEAAAAAKALEDRRLDEAGANAEEALETLSNTMRSSPESPAEPGSRPPSPAALTARQEAISEQIESLRAGRLQEALAKMESRLEAEAAALETRSEGSSRSLENLKQNAARDRSREAQRALERGESEAGQSSDQLARAQEQQNAAAAKGEVPEGQLADEARSAMRRGQKNQGQSARSLDQAAQSFLRSSEAIGSAIEGLEPSDMDERLTDSKDLADGFQDVARSSQSQSADEAAEQSQEAAKSLSQLARTALQKLGSGSPNPAAPKPPTGQDEAPQGELAGDPTSAELNETGKKSADWDGSGLPPELSQLGVSLDDWTRFKGALAGGNASAIETELPAEYRELVGRYFQVIAKEAGKGK